MISRNYMITFVMEPSEGYDPYVTMWTASSEGEACALAWGEIEQEWDLVKDGDWELPRTNEHGKAYMASCVSVSSDVNMKNHETLN